MRCPDPSLVVKLLPCHAAALLSKCAWAWTTLHAWSQQDAPCPPGINGHRAAGAACQLWRRLVRRWRRLLSWQKLKVSTACRANQVHPYSRQTPALCWCTEVPISKQTLALLLPGAQCHPLEKQLPAATLHGQAVRGRCMGWQLAQPIYRGCVACTRSHLSRRPVQRSHHQRGCQAVALSSCA